MGSQIAIFICTFAVINIASSQCLNRILSNYGSNIPIAESLLPSLVGNQLNYLPYDILPNVLPGPIQPNVLQLPNGLQTLPGGLQTLPGGLQTLPGGLQTLPGGLQTLPGGLQTLPNGLQTLPNGLQQFPNCVTPTIVQDSTVVNNLANALQLLVVSNLLGNTLPQVDRLSPVEYISPSSRGYNYLY